MKTIGYIINKLGLMCLLIFLCWVCFSTSFSASTKQYVEPTNKSLSVGFNTFDIVESYPDEKDSNQATPQLVGEAYAFPSPAPNGETEIGFRLEHASMELTFSLFNVYGTQLYSTTETYGTGYNRIPIQSAVLGFPLSVGVYYFTLQDSNNIVLSKGKFGVVQ